MEPSPTALYGPMGDFRFALEARKGFYESQGVRQGEARLRGPARRRATPCTTHSHGSRHKGRLRTVARAQRRLSRRRARAGGRGRAASSLLADAVHLLVDAGGILLSLVAIWFAERPATAKKTYGYYRVEILAALVNGVVLCVLALGILWQAWERLLGAARTCPAAPLHRRRRPSGSASTCVALRLLHAGARESLNVRAAYLEVLGDALSLRRGARGRRGDRADRLDAGRPARRRRHRAPDPAAHRRAPHPGGQRAARGGAAHLDLGEIEAAHGRGARASAASTISTCGRSPPGARP